MTTRWIVSEAGSLIMKLPGAELLMVEIPDKRTFGHLAADWDH